MERFAEDSDSSFWRFVSSPVLNENGPEHACQTDDIGHRLRRNEKQTSGGKDETKYGRHFYKEISFKSRAKGEESYEGRASYSDHINGRRIDKNQRRIVTDHIWDHERCNSKL